MLWHIRIAFKAGAMRTNRSLLCLFLLCLPLLKAPADETLSIPGGGPSPGFVSALPASEITVSAGKPAIATLQFNVKSGYHINSNRPNSDLLIPTKLKLDPPTDIGIGQVTYPDGQELNLSFSQEKFSVYTGEFSVLAKVSAVRTATPGTYRVYGVLDYQACNDRACFPPKHLPVSFDVKVLRSHIRPDRPRVHNPPQSPHIHN
jgi:hypothetical protein